MHLFTRKKAIVLSFLVAAAGAVSGVFSDQSCVIRIDKPSQELFSRCYDEGRDIASYIPGTYLDLVVRESEVPGFSSRCGSVRVLETSADINARRVFRNGMLIPSGYMTYDEMVKKLQEYAQQYPQICKLYDLGDSHGKTYTGADYAAFKHDIWAMKVSDNVGQSEAEPKFYFMGEHHAREPASLDVCMAILEYLLKGYAADPAIADRINNCEIWFVPLVNPDGHKVALSDTAHNQWRKNIRDNDNDGKISYDTPMGGNDASTDDGVDLNRNYPHQWGTTGTTTGNPGFATYCGPSPFSEPEIACLKPLLEEQRFVAGLSYHLYSELVLWAYGYRQWCHAPDSAALGDLGRKIAAKLPKKSAGGTYKPGKASDLYAASGTLEDYAYAQFGTFSYCIEMNDNSFYPPEAEVERLKQNNKAVAMELLNRVTYSCITGLVTKGAGAVEAEVYVKEIDDTVKTKTHWRGPVMTNKSTGLYFRLLLPGTYTVTFKPKDPAFKDTTISGVAVSADKVTTVNINYGGSTGILSPGTPATEGITLRKNSSGAIRFLLPPAHKRPDRIRLFSISGQCVGSFRAGPGQSCFEIDAASYGRGVYLVRFEGDGFRKDAAFVLKR